MCVWRILVVAIYILWFDKNSYCSQRNLHHDNDSVCSGDVGMVSAFADVETSDKQSLISTFIEWSQKHERDTIHSTNPHTFLNIYIYIYCANIFAKFFMSIVGGRQFCHTHTHMHSVRTSVSCMLLAVIVMHSHIVTCPILLRDFYFRVVRLNHWSGGFGRRDGFTMGEVGAHSQYVGEMV